MICCDGKTAGMVLSLICLFILMVIVLLGSLFIYVNVPECGQLPDSAKFSISAHQNWRIFKGNSCPGYDWRDQKTPHVAGAYPFNFRLPLNPRFGGEFTHVGQKTTERVVGGPIGYALNGVAIFSNADGDGNDAVIRESLSFDQCSGHNAPHGTLISAFLPGQYHYHGMPGDTDRGNHDKNNASTNIKYCDDVSTWYQESKQSHSPIVGFMLDGVPIYGPKDHKGMPPKNLDKCGGHAHEHAHDGLAFYHYHFRTVYPYSIECFTACLESTPNRAITTRRKCNTDGVTQYDYTPLATFNISYGKGTENEKIRYGSALFMIAAAFMGALGLTINIYHEYCKGRVVYRSLRSKDTANDSDDEDDEDDEENEDFAVEMIHTGGSSTGETGHGSEIIESPLSTPSTGTIDAADKHIDDTSLQQTNEKNNTSHIQKILKST